MPRDADSSARSICLPLRAVTFTSRARITSSRVAYTGSLIAQSPPLSRVRWGRLLRATVDGEAHAGEAGVGAADGPADTTDVRQLVAVVDHAVGRSEER